MSKIEIGDTVYLKGTVARKINFRDNLEYMLQISDEQVHLSSVDVFTKQEMLDELNKPDIRVGDVYRLHGENCRIIKIDGDHLYYERMEENVVRLKYFLDNFTKVEK